MELEDAQLKYLDKMVKHKTKPWVFFIWNVSLLGKWSNNEIQVVFRHPYYKHIPIGQPSSASVNELESDWEIVSEPV